MGKTKLKYLLLAAGVLASQISKAQPPTDCVNAIGVCSNGVINLNSNGAGINDFASAANGQGCLSGLEHQSVWLYIQISSGTTLGFTITPVAGFGEDYDFAVYGPDRTCGALGNPIRCSWADGFCDYCPSTGLNSTSTDNSEGANGDGFVRRLNVSAGQTYYILVDNYNASSSGFTLTWTGNAVLDCSVTMDCPEFDLGEDIVLCGGDAVTIGVPAASDETYHWNTGSTSSSIPVFSSGIYWLDVTKDGCTRRDSIAVTTLPEINVELGNDMAICQGEGLILDASQVGQVSYVWQNGSTAPSLSVDATGLYWVSVSNGLCTVRDSILVSVLPVPIFDLGPDTSLCEGQTYVLDASTTPQSSFIWQDGTTSSTYTLSAAEHSGLYIATASNSGCSYTDSVHIVINPMPQIDLGGDTSLCEGEALVIDQSLSNAESYLWQDGSTEAQITIEETGTYSLVASISHCTVSQSISVDFLPVPVFDLGEDTSTCGETVMLSVLSPFATGYLWQNGSDLSDLLVSQSGSYSVTASNGGCRYTDSIQVNIFDQDEFTLGNDTSICDGAVLILDISATGAETYLWQDGSSGPVFHVRETGSYSVAAISGACTAADTIQVTFLKVPMFDLALDTDAQPIPLLLCEGDAVSLNALSPHATSYIWQDGSGTPFLTAYETGIYSATAYNQTCSWTNSISLFFNPVPEVDLGNDSSICAGASLILDAASPLATGYIWQDGSGEPTYSVTESGIYSVMVAANNCIANDTVRIQVYERPEVELGSDTALCGEGALFLNAYSTNATSWLWQDGSTSPTYMAEESGTYSVSVSNESCEVRDVIHIEYSSFPEFNLGVDAVICVKDELTLYGPEIPGASYLWSDGSTAPSIPVRREGLYFLTVETACGIFSDTIAIEREHCDCDIQFPTGFTPNGDGLNDVFFPFVLCDGIFDYELEIFNRWGERIFFSDDISQQWTPSADGNKEMDTYIWAVRFSWIRDGQDYSASKSGSVLLLK